MTQKIIPHLWFDKEAKQAAEFYVSVFPNSKITSSTTLHDTPSGNADVMAFDLNGYSFMAISAGPYFKINPSVSFFVNFDPSKDKNAKENLTAMWEKLSVGGKALMELAEYPFSKWYGWVQDKFGVTWQLMLTNPEGEDRPYIIPSAMFVGDVSGKSKEATDFYLSVFSVQGGSASGGKNSKRGTLAPYPKGMNPDTEGGLMFTDFMLVGQWFAAMDGGHKHDFKFNEAISYMVLCKDQAEIDYYWDKLSAVPEAEQCGWLKDKYGFSWQIAPVNMQDMLKSDDKEKVKRVTEAFLKMKKFDLKKLEEAAEGK